MKIFIVIVAVLIVLALGVIYFRQKTQGESAQTQVSTKIEGSSEKPIAKVTQFETKRASFAIFTNGIMRSFAASKYHNLSPNVFITAKDPSIITVTVPNATWNEFFLSLPMRLNPECLITGDNESFCNGEEGKISFYINGVEDKSALIKPIKQGDTFLVSFGNETKEQIQSQISKITKLPQN